MAGDRVTTSTFRPRKEKNKYDKGRVPAGVLLDMDPELRQVGLELLSLSKAESTWKCATSATNGVLRMENEFDIDLSYPWDPKKLLNYIAACKLSNHKSSTVTVNLSHIRQHHRLLGHSFTADSVFSKHLLDGMKHADKNDNKRIAMTPRLMLLLKHRLKETVMTKYDKLLYWCVACWAFSGSFRCGELLTMQTGSYKENDLLGSRVRWHSDAMGGYIEVDLLCPKEARSNKMVTVELLQMNSKMLCPFDAWVKWRKVADRELRLEADLPVFRFASGRNLSTKLLNIKLKDLLGQDIDYQRQGRRKIFMSL